MKNKKKKRDPYLLRMVRAMFPVFERVAPVVSDRIFRLVFYVPLKYPVPDKEREMEKDARTARLQVNGKKIVVSIWGDLSRPYVLLVHGWAGRATQFRKFVPALLQKGYAVVGPDGPAHGRSEGRATSIPEFDLMFRTIYKEYGEPAGIITHSFGGAAILYSAMNGLPIRKLVTIASPSIGDEILKTFLRAINGSWKSAERFKTYVLRRTGRSFDEFTASHAIQRLPHPIDLLVINDTEDKDVVFRSAEEIVRVYPSAKLYSTTGLGHTRILRDDQVITQAVEFVTGR